MLRLLRCFLWLRWRTFCNSFRMRRHDPLERLARVGGAVAPILLAVLLVPLALALAVAAFVVGRMLVDGPVPQVARLTRLVLDGWLAFVLMWSARAAVTARGQEARLLLLPIPRRALHAVAVATGLADPLIAMLGIVVLCLAIGLASAGSLAAALLALVAGALLLAAFLAISAGASFALQLGLRGRRRRELATILLTFVLTLGGLAAQLVMTHAADRSARGGGAVSPIAAPASGWLALLPTELYMRAVDRAAAGSGRGVLDALLGLVVFGGVFYAGSAVVFDRLLVEPEGGDRRRRAAPAVARVRLLRGLSPATAAVASAQARLIVRSVQGRVALLVSPATAVIVAVAMPRAIWRTSAIHGPALGGLVAALTLVGLARLALNCFATDGAGLQLGLLAPLTDAQLVRGKVVGCVLLSWAVLLPTLAVAAVLDGGGDFVSWSTVVVAAMGSLFFSGPACALLAALLPRAADLNTFGQRSQPHALATFAGLVVQGFALGPPLAFLLLGTLAAAGAPLLAGLIVAWCGALLGLGALVERAAAAAVAARRENLLLVALDH